MRFVFLLLRLTLLPLPLILRAHALEPDYGISVIGAGIGPFFLLGALPSTLPPLSLS